MTIIKTFDTEEPKKSFPKKYIVLTIFSLVILSLVEIWANNTVIAYGDKYDKLASAEKGLRMENLILENNIAQSASFKEIATKSAELGFSSIQSIQYIR